MSEPTGPNPLAKLYDIIERGHIQKDIELDGSTFTFRSLNDEEYAWRDQFLGTSLPVMALFSAQRAPTLAIATVAINGVSAASLPGMAPDDTQVGVDTKFAVAFNLRRKLYSEMPRDFIERLYDLYMTEIEVPARTVKEADVKKS